MKHTKKILAGAMAVALTAPMVAMATNGYFAHGYGQRALGMGGAGVASSKDATAAATNPAGMVHVGNRMDIGLQVFRPQRESTIEGNIFPGVDGTYSGNEEEIFPIPEFGYNTMLSNNMSFGVSVVGNGGMNSTYDRNNGLFGSTVPGVDLAQLLILPTLAYKINNQHSIGASLVLAYQRFSAYGLQNFDNATNSSAPGSVTNNNHDDSTGLGIRIGWQGKINDKVTLGATYASRTYMSEFDKYKGLFAEQGDFDIPTNFAIGIAIQATPKLNIAFDVEEIKYGEVAAIANSLTQLTVGGKQLGADDGPGFGWQDMTVYKLGFEYQHSKNLVLRAGLNHGGQPIPKEETFFNILAPGVVEDHLTLGATWTMKNGAELTAHYMHAFEEKVNGSGSIPPGAPPGFGGGEANLKMYQDSLGVSYGWKF